MKQTINMEIDMRDEVTGCLCVTLHPGVEKIISIHGASLPVTIDLTPDQVFNLFVELKSVLKTVQLVVKERR